MAAPETRATTARAAATPTTSLAPVPGLVVVPVVPVVEPATLVSALVTETIDKFGRSIRCAYDFTKADSERRHNQFLSAI